VKRFQKCAWTAANPQPYVGASEEVDKRSSVGLDS
jgi:hypothetical protein